jgi:hypothetical protein
MRDGKEIWLAADEGTKSGDERSANVMRLFALAQILAQAETAVLKDDVESAARHLRDLQSYTGELLAHLVRPALVDAA